MKYNLTCSEKAMGKSTIEQSKYSGFVFQPEALSKTAYPPSKSFSSN